MAIVGVRCIPFVGETSLCLVMASASSARRHKMPACSNAKCELCLSALTGSCLQFPELKQEKLS